MKTDILSLFITFAYFNFLFGNFTFIYPFNPSDNLSFNVVQLKLSPIFFTLLTAPLHPAHHLLPQSVPTLLSMSMVLYICSLTRPFPFFSPLYPPPFCSLSVCSLFPCLQFYFAHLFVLFIWFHL